MCVRVCFVAVVCGLVIAQRKQKPETKQKRKRKFSSTFLRLPSGKKARGDEEGKRESERGKGDTKKEKTESGVAQ